MMDDFPTLSLSLLRFERAESVTDRLLGGEVEWCTVVDEMGAFRVAHYGLYDGFGRCKIRQGNAMATLSIFGSRDFFANAECTETVRRGIQCLRWRRLSLPKYVSLDYPRRPRIEWGLVVGLSLVRLWVTGKRCLCLPLRSYEYVDRYAAA